MIYMHAHLVIIKLGLIIDSHRHAPKKAMAKHTIRAGMHNAGHHPANPLKKSCGAGCSKI